MSDPLFPGFEAAVAAGPVGPIAYVSGGSGPPVVLLHGFPQTHAMWHKIAPAVATRFTVVAPDLRGYGASAAPGGDATHDTFSKRAMGDDVVALMRALGHERFAVVGHDRGARVGYRLALDRPDRVERLALLDIIPTLSMWEQMDGKRAMQVYHWTFLAQPAPMPERLIAGAPEYWQDEKLKSWAGPKSLAPFDPRALDAYHAFFREPARIHACCEDYRAGATLDVERDRADRDAGRRIACPVLVLWGDKGIPAASSTPLDVWHATFAPQAVGGSVESGHFLPEENPEQTLAALLPFLAPN
jgi:haloacetate dehalogenase